MKRLTVLLLVFAGIFCLPAIFYAQISSTDKYRMQEQFDKFKNQVQGASRNTMANSQEVAQEKKLEAEQYTQRQEAATEVFDKLAKKSQESSFTHMTRVYILPILIFVGLGFIFFLILHQKL